MVRVVPVEVVLSVVVVVVGKEGWGATEVAGVEEVGCATGVAYTSEEVGEGMAQLVWVEGSNIQFYTPSPVLSFLKNDQKEGGGCPQRKRVYMGSAKSGHSRTCSLYKAEGVPLNPRGGSRGMRRLPLLKKEGDPPPKRIRSPPLQLRGPL